MPLTYRAKNKLVHESFRLEEDVLETLGKEARKRGTSLSYLVNTILKSYANSDRYFQELGFILIGKDSLRKAYGRIEERQLVEDGKELGLVAREYISYFFIDINSYTLIEFLELWFSKFQSFQHKVEDKCHQFCLNHDINMNFSIYLGSFLKALIESIIDRPLKLVTQSSNSLAFSFEIS